MRSSFVASTGLKLVRTPSARQQALRLWLALFAGVAALAIAGVAAGLIVAPHGPQGPAATTGPFSYFPS